MQPDHLIAELQNKNPQALKEIYTRYSESMFGIIFNIIREEKLSEEILQDVFIKIWNNAESYQPEKGRFFTWILNIARNTAIDVTRSKSFKNKQQNLNSDYFVDILEEKNDFSHKIDAIGIKKYINVLKPYCKKIIDLLFFKGYTQVEAAENLSMPVGTIKTRSRNCINKLREILIES